MTFLNTGLAAAGLACISIPIIIHLLMHRRRKPVMWGAMRFLLEAYRRQQKRLMVEKWLLLLVRCLLVACVAAAIGKPLLGAIGFGGNRERTLFVLIDNGVAAGLTRDGAAALEAHKARAKELVRALQNIGGGGERERVGLITLGGPARGVVMPPSADLASVLALIDQVRATDSRSDLSGGLALVASAIAEGERGGGGEGGPAIRADRCDVAVLSDFLDGSLDARSAEGGGDSVSVRLPEGVRLLCSSPRAAGAEEENVSIVSVEPLRSVIVGGKEASAGSGSDLVRVALRRTGTGVARAQVVHVTAGLVRPGDRVRSASVGERTAVRFTPGQETAQAVVPLTGEGAGRGGERGAGVIVARIDDDGLASDDRWRRPVDVREALRVGVVAPTRFGGLERADKLDAGSWARLALSPGGGEGIDVVDIEPAGLDSARLSSLDALVLPRPDLVADSSWGRIRLFLESGGMVLVAPPSSVSVHLWTDAMNAGLGLDWSLPREAAAVGPGAKLTVPKAAGGADEGSGLFSLIGGEMDALLSPVSVRKVLALSPTPEDGRTLIGLGDGRPFLFAAGGDAEGAGAEQRALKAAGGGNRKAEWERRGRGMLVYLAVPMDLEWSDLPAKPFMVPMMQELIRQGVGRARGTFEGVAGTRVRVPARTVELRAEVDAAGDGAGGQGPGAAGAGEDRSIRVDASGVPSEPIRAAGVWRAVDELGTTRGIVTVNTDVRGTRVGTQTREAVGAWLSGAVRTAAGKSGKDAIVWLGEDKSGVGGEPGKPDAVLAKVFARAEKGTVFAWPFLVAALALAVLELGLARLASHARSGGTSVRSVTAVQRAKEAA